jgi:hypothetical protein
MKMSIEERIKALEKKVLVLEGGTILKEEPMEHLEPKTVIAGKSINPKNG